MGIGVFCYVAGFLVNSFCLAQFSIVNVDDLRTRYILTGGLFLAFAALLLDGALRSWQLAGRLGSDRIGAIGVSLVKNIVLASLIVLGPFMLFIYLPAYLERRTQSGFEPGRA